MLDLQHSTFPLFAFLAGLSLHVSIYRYGDWELVLPKLYSTYALVEISIIAWVQLQNDQRNESLYATVQTVLWLGTCHILGIVTSMLIYRIFFHRLRFFPGPFWGSVSNLYATMLATKDLRLHTEVEALHKQYGDFVRLGPTELSITDPKAMEAIYSAKSPCTKGTWCDVVHPRVSMSMIRDKNEHARRRKFWDQGFGTRALRDYEPRVAKYTDQLLAQIEATVGKPINVSDWFGFYAFDVMGDLAFGKSFNMLRDGVKHYFLKSLHADLAHIRYVTHQVWLIPFLQNIPVVNAHHNNFFAWLRVQVAERRKTKPDRPDIFSWILEGHESRPETEQTKHELDGDAHLIVVAGSDITGSTLTTIIFELAKDQAQVDRLRVEIDDYFSSVNEISYISLGKLTHIDAVINEALRLHPPIPSGAQRETPPEGLYVGDTFIPGNTTVQVPMHTVFRDARFFERPTEFIPERWTTHRELTHDASVFTPFSLGPYSCVGKRLAQMELRYVVSQIVHRYDIKLAPGQRADSFEEGKKDTVTISLEPLNLVFSHRA